MFAERLHLWFSSTKLKVQQGGRQNHRGRARHVSLGGFIAAA